MARFLLYSGLLFAGRAPTCSGYGPCPVVALSCMSACHQRDGCVMSVAVLRRTASLQSMPFDQIVASSWMTAASNADGCFLEGLLRVLQASDMFCCAVVAEVECRNVLAFLKTDHTCLTLEEIAGVLRDVADIAIEPWYGADADAVAYLQGEVSCAQPQGRTVLRWFRD